jgi:hypothetical protein
MIHLHADCPDLMHDKTDLIDRVSKLYDKLHSTNPTWLKQSNRWNSIALGFGRLWDAKEGFGRLWDAKEGFGRLWEAKEGFGRLWEAKEGFGVLHVVAKHLLPCAARGFDMPKKATNKSLK